jgi:hypothetical protein
VSLARENPNWLNLPTPREPLRAWTEQEIEPGVMIAVMEAVIEMVKCNLISRRGAWLERAQ